MEQIKTLLIANRGEIACRIIKTARQLGIKTISIYTPADAASLHVSQADVAIQLPGSNTTAYTNGDAIINLAKENGANAIIPGYGFLSENADFARVVQQAGLAWCGPSAEAIEKFGVKHIARELAEQAGVPIVPGTKGLVETEDEAIKESERIGYPVMLKATGGGGGMGLVVCHGPQDVRQGFKTVRSRGETLFKNAGLFIERYIDEGHHIEVQVFGNGLGEAIHYGERECSIQRRNQKVIEECPSPFVEKHPNLRKKLCETAVNLAKLVNYGSAGTVEYIVDDRTAEFYFLEMNTRLQVEHGITELCYDVDLVELMLKQADAELAGSGGLPSQVIKPMQPAKPIGTAIEARVYAENPVRDYAPTPGLLQRVEWQQLAGSRVDTWVFTGSTITPNYDPLIAKVMNHAKTRSAAIKGLEILLSRSVISGPPSNLEFLAAIMRDANFQSGRTLTGFLDGFRYEPCAIDVISSGAYTLIQDLPGRPHVGKGIPHSGAMDPVALSIANMLVGNEHGKEGLEITLSGPELRFLGPATVALTGAPMEFYLDGDPVPMWTRKHIKSGQRIKIGKSTGGGCRSYLAIYGGFPTVADYFGSKGTSPLVGIGGYQGRSLAPGDLLPIVRDPPRDQKSHPSVPELLRPQYPEHWEIMAMPGPHQEGYLTQDDVDMLYHSDLKVSHNASRSGIRLIPPRAPHWARKDGGEGGSHPSNLVEYGYPLGTLNWTGDDPCIFPVDCPNFGGFVSSTTTIRADWWKLGQMKAGNSMRYVRVSLEEALILRKRVDEYLHQIQKGIQDGDFQDTKPLETSYSLSDNFGEAIIWERAAEANRPQVRYRQGGDDFLLVEYGNEEFDINHRCRVTALENAVHDGDAPTWLKSNLVNTVGCCTSLLLFYDGSKMQRSQLVTHLQSIEDQLGDLSHIKVPCRRFKLPLSFESKEQTEATQRYIETQRPHAPYLPDNLEFVAKNNAFTPEQLKHNMLNVSEDELNKQLGLFRSGQYKFEWEDVEFDMAAHNKLLQETADEVKEIRSNQAKVQEAMIEAEQQSLLKWREEKQKNKVDEGTVDALLADSSITAIDSPVDANIWKVLIEEKGTLQAEQVAVILEAMKLEINVNVPADLANGKLEKMLVEPGETVKAGAHLALIRRQ
ncbi:3-methylcrotonyl-CoA carboxylase subunit alpha [Hortaea werneckii]|nr:3-methylcrotonyl-CoA carboxylase subunit alpha [Hortaea werneckii]